MTLLERSKIEIAANRPHMKKKKVLFQQRHFDKSMKMIKLNEVGFELVPQAQYSPDQAPSSY